MRSTPLRVGLAVLLTTIVGIFSLIRGAVDIVRAFRLRSIGKELRAA